MLKGFQLNAKVWQPKPPKMTSKQKIAYVMTEMGLGDLDKPKVISALQSQDWHIASAIQELRNAS
jgi:hypothetical protein